MKNYLSVLICLIFLLGSDQSSDALTYKFEDTIIGVPFQATMEINVSGNTLTISLENTSPVTVGPTIIGFGVPIGNYDSIKSGGFSWKPLISGGTDVSSGWYRFVGGYSTNQIYFYAQTSFDALYNPLYNNSGNVTPASMVITFNAGNPILDMTSAPFIDVGNIGTSSLPYVSGTLVATPEPGTMLLLGLGLIGIGIVMRELF